MNISIVWIDGSTAQFKNVVSAQPDPNGHNLQIYIKDNPNRGPHIASLIPLHNVREVQYS